MGFLFSSQKKERTIAIFDIGSGSVGGAMVKIPIDGSGVPVILKSVNNNEIKFRKDFDFNSMLKDMTSALYLTANSLFDKKAGAPDEIFCVLASPWYLSETIVIKMAREKSFIFNKRLANDLIQKEILNLTEIFKNKYSDEEGSPEIIEQNTMAVSLNGYTMIDPLGKKCNSLRMDMLISLAPKLCLNKIRDTLSKIFNHTKISFSSFTMASFLAVRDKYVKEDSYLLIDISGEITDVGIVSKGILKSVLSFPYGKKTFYNQICSKMNIELRDAKELFNLYKEGNLSSDFNKKVTPIFESIEKSWNESFHLCINTLPKTIVLSKTIFLTADNDIKDWFADVLRKEANPQSTVSDYKSNVITLDGPEFLNMCNIKEGLCDPFIMIEAIAIMRKIGK
ncbi:MAG TPA: hypothetical protein VIK86_03455 [Candidatus Paceibacterota bacterium]